MVINKDKEEGKEVILAKIHVCPSNSHISVAYVKSLCEDVCVWPVILMTEPRRGY